MRPVVLLATTFFLVQTGSINRVFAPKENLEKQVSPLARKARLLAQTGRYREAADQYRLAVEQETGKGNHAAAAHALTGLAGCQLLTFSYQDAMAAYLQAKQLALKTGHRSLLLIIDANLALLYGVIGDYSKTIEIGESVLHQLGNQPSPSRPYVLFYLASAYNRTQRFQLAKSYFIAAAEEADRFGDLRQRAVSLDNLGLAYIERQDAARAESYINEAFRQRAMGIRDELSLSYRSLGKLNRLQGKLEQANKFLTKAIDGQRTDPKKTKIHELYGERAQIQRDLGDTAGSLHDYRSALHYIRRWRLELSQAAASLQARSETDIAALRSSFIQFASDQALKSGDQALAFEALIAAEESRFASLRAISRRGPMPLEYHEKLAQLRDLDALLLTPSAPAEARSRLHRLQTELIEIETLTNLSESLAMPPSNPPAIASRIVNSLGRDEAILSFHLDNPASYVWEVTSKNIRLHKLRPKDHLQKSIARFRVAVQRSQPDISSAGEQLYSEIFGEISQDARTKKIWTVVLDDRLFELPLSALMSPVTGNSGQKERKVFLVEQHILRIVPSLFMSMPGRTDKSPQTFVGLGDPIYNRADPRLNGRASSGFSTEAVQLPRLFGSATEIDRCARSWQGPAVILKGMDANRGKLLQSISKSPAVLHFATHFIRTREDDTRLLVALGYNPDTHRHDLLGDEQVSSLRTQLGLVVLSGCQSGFGETLAGAGLMGLTRAWLISGARNVTASHWPTPDDTGEIFARFYRHYVNAIEQRMSYPAARSLQQAQIEMLHSNNWRNSPRYWAAYFLISRG